MPLRNAIAATAACLLFAACTGKAPQHTADATTAPPAPQRAGQPVDPLKTAGHITAARIAALTGDQEAVRHNTEAMTDDMRRAMKLPDASRPIDREAARAAVRTVTGVRSVAWLARSNRLVRVAGAHRRTHQVIDEICARLEPLGDTLAVVVHLQNTDARTRSEADTLSRNCQLAPGDRALLQADRQVDVLDPALRARARADTERMRARNARRQEAGDRAAVEAIPEM
jgi:hypothetical protein